MSEDKKLTVKEQKFVATLVSGNSDSAMAAVVDAGYNASTPKSASNMANKIMKRPHIQNALARAIEKKFPDIPGLGAQVVYDILQSPEEPSAMKLKALDMLIKIFGWQAPSKHAILKADLNDLALPGEDET